MASSSSNKFDEFLLNFKREKGTPAIEIKILKILFDVFQIARLSVCKVKQASNEEGTGSFYELFDLNGKTIFTFMTCNHVLPTNSVDEISKTVLEFEEIDKMKSINLERKDIKYIWTSKIFDATVVEISEELANSFKSYGAKFLRVGQIQLTATMEFVILQYPKGEFCIAYGKIDHINGRYVYYKVGTAPGSSGSPLVNINCEPLAMHNAGLPGSKGENPDILRQATALNHIVEAFLQEKSNDSHLQ